VKYELGLYIPEHGILHSHRRENLKPYNMVSRVMAVQTPLEASSVFTAKTDPNQWQFTFSHLSSSP
jgi:hypothetical protein